MKLLFLILIFPVLFIYKYRDSSITATKERFQTTNSFDWLLGKWQRSNEQKGRETFEYWEKKNNSEYSGFGFTLQKKDTIWKENIRLIKSGEGWNFEVTGEGETNPTRFKLTSIEKEEFSCENKENEFPKNIIYSKNGDTLVAIISGGNMEIPFEFEKVALNQAKD